MPYREKNDKAFLFLVLKKIHNPLKNKDIK